MTSLEPLLFWKAIAAAEAGIISILSMILLKRNPLRAIEMLEAQLKVHSQDLDMLKKLREEDKEKSTTKIGELRAELEQVKMSEGSWKNKVDLTPVIERLNHIVDVLATKV
jgi:hypothetical protein